MKPPFVSEKWSKSIFDKGNCMKMHIELYILARELAVG